MRGRSERTSHRIACRGFVLAFTGPSGNSWSMSSELDRESRALLTVAAVLAALAIALGAFSAHALEHRLSPQELGWWHTGTEYQMWHALGILALGLSGLRRWRLPAWLLVGGTVVFCGTLYLMALGAPHWLGAITPVGGLMMIFGWLLLGWRSSFKP